MSENRREFVWGLVTAYIKVQTFQIYLPTGYSIRLSTPQRRFETRVGSLISFGTRQVLFTPPQLLRHRNI
jgi:hypothetical protein